MSMDRRMSVGGFETITDLPGDVIYMVRDNKNVKIGGTIQQGATIHKKGNGRLFVAGHVEEGVKFIISDMGDVVFAQRPPESVVEAIEKSGKGEVIMPGGYSPRFALNVKAAQTVSGLSNGFNTSNILQSMTQFGQAALVANRPSLKLKEPASLITGQSAEVNARPTESQQTRSIYQAQRGGSPVPADQEAEKSLSTPTITLGCK